MPDDIDTQVLRDLNTRTLVNGAAIDTDLISRALGLSASELRDCLDRLQKQRFVALDSVDRVRITPLGHEHLTLHIVAPNDRDAGEADGRAQTADSIDHASKIFYTSQNGDTWLLVTDSGGQQLVRHTGNRSSGGASEVIDLQSFLDREPHSPQNQALERALNSPNARPMA